MSITLAQFLIITAGGIGYGWLWTQSGLVRPVRDQVERWFPEEIQYNQGWRGWVSYGLHCPACTGFYPQLAGMALVDWGPWFFPLAIAALVIHLAWLNVTAALIAIQLR